jgi:AbiV family abortive infection protein
MRKTLTKYKFIKLAVESFKNGIRLHFDSILLFNNKSYPSAFQLSVLSLEEFSKSYWIEHYYYSSITNCGFPDQEFEQKWLNLLFFHPEKQKAFFGWGMHFDYSPKFIAFVKENKLDLHKQLATYVGLTRIKHNVDVNSRISTPMRIKESEAKKMISLISDYLKDICVRKEYQEMFFDIEEKDKLISDELFSRLKIWKYKSGLKSDRWFNEWNKR